MAHERSSSSTESNQAVVVAMYEAAARGDIDTVTSLLADDVLVREPGFLPYGRDYHGIEEFLGLFGQIATLLDVSRVAVEQVIGGGEHVAAIIRIPDLQTGQDTELIELSTVRASKIVEMKIYFHDAQSMVATADVSHRDTVS